MTESSTKEAVGQTAGQAAGEKQGTAGAERTDGNLPDTALGPSAAEPAEASAAEPNAPDDSDDEPDEEVESASAAVPLQSLTPHYEPKHHATYLRRLEEALKDPRNRNIALTGRYGAGKSSVLDKFEEKHRKVTQRLSISTLAPGDQGESTTNRIQKEIVKHCSTALLRRSGETRGSAASRSCRSGGCLPTRSVSSVLSHWCWFCSGGCRSSTGPTRTPTPGSARPRGQGLLPWESRWFRLSE